jgi:hypothetical protein
MWTSAPSMVLARRWAASIVVNNTIYVIGRIIGYFVVSKIFPSPSSHI